MNWLWLASEIHGIPLGKSAATACCWEPAEISVIVPLITKGALVVTPVLGASTVNLLGPLP
jgi:hypothetical protein